MTAIRAREERRTILDFSNGKYSKNKIKCLLQRCRVSSIEGRDYTDIIFIDNHIKIGMYVIQLHLATLDLNRLDLKAPGKLKDFGGFSVSIFERAEKFSIDLRKDNRFQDQNWVSPSCYGKLRVKQLVDIIHYCRRLNNLRCYL